MFLTQRKDYFIFKVVIPILAYIKYLMLPATTTSRRWSKSKFERIRGVLRDIVLNDFKTW